jgi:hypothetical protein
MRFTYEELHELYSFVGRNLGHEGRGQGHKRYLQPIDSFFIFLLYLTSGSAHRRISLNTGLALSQVSRIIKTCLEETAKPLEALFPKDSVSVHCDAAFEHFPAAFAIVDASSIFMQRPSRHQTQYYSGKYKRHCIKVQALVTPDGQCVHLSRVFRGCMHDKLLFHLSGAIRLLKEQDDTGREQCKLILADLGYLGIQRSGARAVLPHKPAAGQELTAQQKKENRILPQDRILIENFFGRCKSLFGMCSWRYKGCVKQLSRIIRSTLIITN